MKTSKISPGRFSKEQIFVIFFGMSAICAVINDGVVETDKKGEITQSSIKKLLKSLFFVEKGKNPSLHSK